MTPPSDTEHAMPRLFIKDGTGQGLYHELSPGTTTIGRGRDCTIEMGSLGVSRTHAAIQLAPGGEAVIEDMGSKNGTLVNGARVERAVLREGDEIAIGQASFVYHAGATDGGAEPEAAPLGEGRVESEVRSVMKVDPMRGVDRGEEADSPEVLRKSHRYLAILYRVGRTVSATLNLNELLKALMDIVFEVVHPDEAFIMLKDEATGALKLRIFRSKASTAKEGTVAVSRTILDKVTREGVAILSADASADSRFSAAKSVLRFHMMSTMCVPLMREEKVLGVIHVANRVSSGEFREEDLQLFSGIAAQAALAIENATLYHNIQLEVRRRNNLQRYLPPSAVEQIMDGTRELNLGGEIKEVTVLFSDIRGFTHLSEDLPPNEVVGMLNEYFNEMTRIAFRNEGTVDKFIGDALIVVFGAAVPHPDDPSRAARTAAEMQAAMKGLNARWDAQGRKTFQIGIGINTGEVLYGNIGSEQRMELTVIGDVVNLASRLGDVARGGEVLLSGSTRDALGGSVRAERIKPLEVQGKAAPVEVHRMRLE